MKFAVKTTTEYTEVALKGDIDEGAEAVLAEIKAKLKPGRIVFDCDNVQNVNSIGLRHWSSFVSSLTPGYTVEYINCATVLIDYASLSKSFLGGGKIVSFHAPYLCGSCSHSFMTLFQTEAVRAKGGLDPVSCPKCKRAGQLEVQEDVYLDWLF